MIAGEIQNGRTLTYRRRRAAVIKENLRVVEPQVSSSAGRYELHRRLARGGMAELFLASCAGIGGAQKIAVVKRILPELSGDPDFTRMFLNEARLASTLEHPNVVQVFDSGQDGDRYFFAMEYIHGPDVREIMRAQARQGGAIPLSHALTIIDGVCAGLHHAHERRGPDGRPLNIVHRDVSPNNVLVSYEGVVKVVDFGIARASTQTTVTRGGARKGKLSYMSPEQAQGGDLDRRSDVFGIGIMLYELTTMRRLFKGDNELAVLHEILFREVPPPSDVVDDYPAPLEAIVMRALARDRDERFDSAQELQIALEDAADESGLVRSTRSLAAWVADLIPAGPHPSEDLERTDSTATPALEVEEPTRPWTPELEAPEATATINIRPPAKRRRRAAPLVAGAAVIGVGALWWSGAFATAEDRNAAAPREETARVPTPQPPPPRPQAEETVVAAEAEPVADPPEPVQRAVVRDAAPAEPRKAPKRKAKRKKRKGPTTGPAKPTEPLKPF